MTLVPCEACGQRVGVIAMPWSDPAADGRRRIVKHKFERKQGGYVRVDWCPGKYERQEVPDGLQD